MPDLDPEKRIAAYLDTQFEDIAMQLDIMSTEHHLKSDEMIRIINQWGSFATYYADWIRETWEFSEEVNADV